MTVTEAIILGTVQGITEFLPISSSGHLVIFQSLLGANEAGISFDIFLHFASLLAIVVFFSRDLFKIRFKDLLLIGLSSIPAGIIGVLFQDQVESLFNSLTLVGFTLLITGMLNYLTDRKLDMKTAGRAEVNWYDAIKIGLIQALAITPGISRSGSTVFAGVQTGLDRQTAFKYSFLIAIPAILGASLLQLIKLGSEASQMLAPEILAGGIASFLVGLTSLYVFKYIMTKSKFQFFAYYCWGVGLLTLGLSIL